MPKETFTLNDFSGGMNEVADPMDLVENRQVASATNAHFDHKGYISYQDNSPAGDDMAVRNDANNPTIVDLDLGIGAAISTEDGALKITVADASSPDTDLSWEDGVYDFKYTVCKELGNGIIEEGPLQTFGDGSTDGNTTGLSVDMTGDDVGQFTFEHTDHSGNHPAHMNASGYEGKICGRVYYSRQAGQGSSTQTGWIHLCDLILHDYNGADGVHPRAIGLTGTPSTNAITIEEPPTSATFEMNTGYPSDVGVHDAVADFGTLKAVVDLGMIKYIAATKDSKYYIYRSLPGQPDIWPTDNWIQMPVECVNMLGLGNYLCYWGTDNFIVYDIERDIILLDSSGIGLDDNNTAAKCSNFVTWTVGGAHADGVNKVYKFDGKLSEICKGRAKGIRASQIKYYEETQWVSYVDGSSSNLEHIYSPTSDTWFIINYSTTVDQVYFPVLHLGEPSRFKKIYQIVIHGGANLVHGGDAQNLLFKVYDENRTDITSKFTLDSYTNSGQRGTSIYKSNESVKVRGLEIVTDFRADHASFNAANAVIQAISIVYRRTNKFK